MTLIYEYAGAYIILLWMGYRSLTPFVAKQVALGFSIFLVVSMNLLASEVLFLLVAIFAPFGALLPVLAVQNFATHYAKFRATDFLSGEMALVLIAYIAFLSAALGVFSFDPYRHGFSPIIGSALALFLCGYALWRNYYFIAGAVILGQTAWVLDIGSSNYFDHITHILLIPVIFVSLIKRLLNANARRRERT